MTIDVNLNDTSDLVDVASPIGEDEVSTIEITKITQAPIVNLKQLGIAVLSITAAFWLYHKVFPVAKPSDRTSDSIVKISPAPTAIATIPTPTPKPKPVDIQVEGTVNVALSSGEVGSVQYVISIEQGKSYKVAVSNALQDIFAHSTSLGLAIDPQSIRKRVLARLKPLTKEIAIEPSKELFSGYIAQGKAVRTKLETTPKPDLKVKK
jgi:hypothetical protein